MTQMIFINLPVSDLERSVAFYEAIGAERNPFCEDGTAVGVTFSETIHVMLLSHAKFSQFTHRPIAGRETTEVLLCLSRESRGAVDTMVEAATCAGGTPDHSPKQEHPCIYGRSFEDPDGHVWEVMWMDYEGFKAAQQQTAAA